MYNGNFEQESEQVIEKYEPKLRVMFPDFHVNMRVSKLLGTTLWINISSPHEITRHNADVNIDFHVFNEDHVPSLEKNLCPKKYKFRKINGDTLDVMVGKFMVWIAKNESEMKSDWVNYKDKKMSKSDYQVYKKNGNQYVIYQEFDKWNIYQLSWSSANKLVSSHDTNAEAVSAL